MPVHMHQLLLDLPQNQSQEVGCGAWAHMSFGPCCDPEVHACCTACNSTLITYCMQMSPLFQPSPLSTVEGPKAMFGSAPGSNSLPRFADSSTRLPNTSADTAETQFGSSPVAVPSRPARLKRAPAADDFVRGRSAPDPAAPIVENASLPERRSRRSTSSVSAVTRLLKSPNSVPPFHVVIPHGPSSSFPTAPQTSLMMCTLPEGTCPSHRFIFFMGHQAHISDTCSCRWLFKGQPYKVPGREAASMGKICSRNSGPTPGRATVAGHV